MFSLEDVIHPAGTPHFFVNASLLSEPKCSKTLFLTSLDLTGTKLKNVDNIHLYADAQHQVGLGARGMDDMTEAEFLNSVNSARRKIVEFTQPPENDPIPGRVCTKRAQIKVGNVHMQVDWYQNNADNVRYMNFAAWVTGQLNEKVTGLLGHDYEHSEVFMSFPTTCQKIDASRTPGSEMFAQIGY